MLHFPFTQHESNVILSEESALSMRKQVLRSFSIEIWGFCSDWNLERVNVVHGKHGDYPSSPVLTSAFEINHLPSLLSWRKTKVPLAALLNPSIFIPLS